MSNDQHRGEVPVDSESDVGHQEELIHRSQSTGSDDESDDDESTQIKVADYDKINSKQVESSTSLVMGEERTRQKKVAGFVTADSVAIQSESFESSPRTVAFDVSGLDTFETADGPIVTAQRETTTRPVQFGTARAAVNSVHTVAQARITSVTEQIETVQSFQEISQSSMKGEFDEIEIEGEFFEWVGGQPFGHTRPVFIIHRATEDGQSLALLKRLLRDEYSAIVGGEPTAKHVEFVANEPRFPKISSHIVTLDVTGDEWDATVSDKTPEIEGYNQDIVPDLVSQISDGFSGNLGFFILNVPPNWSIELIQSRFYERLRTHLLRDVKNKSVERRVVLAKNPTQESLSELAGGYFGIRSDTMSVEEIESTYDRALSKPHWVRTRFTKLSTGQEDDGESREHYLLKSAIIETIIRKAVGPKVWSDSEKLHASVTRLQENNLVQIQTEKRNGNRVPDISVSLQNMSDEDTRRIATFLQPDAREGQPEQGQDDNSHLEIAIEVETGRSQAGFNLRKVRKTLEKYDHDKQDGTKTVDSVLLVVHPRIANLDRKRSKHLKQIVGEWNETNVADAQMATPKFKVTPDGRLSQLELNRISVENWMSDQDD